MHSIAHYILSYNPDYKIIYTTTETFSNELISAIKNKTQEAFKNKYRNIDMLLIDDIQFIAGKTVQWRIFHTFNTLYENKKQIVISSDKHQRISSVLKTVWSHDSKSDWLLMFSRRTMKHVLLSL